MVKLTLNLRSKKLFFTLSGLSLIFLILHLNKMMLSIDIKAFDIFLVFVIILLTTVTYWIPYQFNEQFV